MPHALEINAFQQLQRLQPLDGAGRWRWTIDHKVTIVDANRIHPLYREIGQILFGQQTAVGLAEIDKRIGKFPFVVDLWAAFYQHTKGTRQIGLLVQLPNPHGRAFREEKSHGRGMFTQPRFIGIDNVGGMNGDRVPLFTNLDHMLKDTRPVHGAKAFQCRAPTSRRPWHHERLDPAQKLVGAIKAAAFGRVGAPALIIQTNVGLALGMIDLHPADAANAGESHLGRAEAGRNGHCRINGISPFH